MLFLKRPSERSSKPSSKRAAAPRLSIDGRVWQLRERRNTPFRTQYSCARKLLNRLVRQPGYTHDAAALIEM